MDKAIKKANKLKLVTQLKNDSEVALLKHIDTIEEELSQADADIKADLEKTIEDKITEVIDSFPTFDEVVNAVKIPDPIPGDKGEPGEKGDAYVLTDEDKMEIALAIDVPVVEKETVIEKTEVIHETPIVTEKIIEKAIADEPLAIAEKLNTLQGAIDMDVIKGLKEIERISKENAFNPTMGPSFSDVNDLSKRITILEKNPSGGGITALTGDVTASGTGSVAATLVSASSIFSMTGVISPTSISTNQNNYNPVGLSTANTIRINPTADVVISGIAGGQNGRILILQNISVTKKINLTGDDANSTAANRFAPPFNSGEGIFIAPNTQLVIVYDSTTSRWRVPFSMQSVDDDGSSTLLFSGGRQYRTLGLNLSNANSWAARQDFKTMSANAGNGVILDPDNLVAKFGDYAQTVNHNVLTVDDANNLIRAYTDGGHIYIGPDGSQGPPPGAYMDFDANKGVIKIFGLPTSDPGITGALYTVAGVLMVSP